jgi:L-lactate dehydrogenase complex protein LldE
MEVQLFIPCFIDQLYPETAFNTIKVLENAGCKVHYNPQQTCCGQPAYNSGYWDEAAKLAGKFLGDFRDDMPIVSPSASCTGFVIHHYPKILKSNTELLNKQEKIKSKIFELSDFLINVLKIEELSVEFNHKVTFHDACSALREYGIEDEPRKLLRMVKGLELIEMPERDTCCGFGGTFAVKNSAISTAMAEKKVLNALKTGVEFIVSTESSCLMNVNGYIAKHKLPIKGIHLADIISGSIH